MLSLPLALFVNTIRNTTKSILEVATWCSEAANIPAPSATVQYVLDGGASLHSIPWTRGETYDQNFGQYSSCVMKKHGRAIFVFGAYSDKPSTTMSQ